MVSNRRKGRGPVPDDFDEHLNEAQQAALRRAEGIGWSVKFVRGKKVVLVYVDGTTLGVLEEDGTLNQHSELRGQRKRDPADGPKPKKFII